MKGNVRFEEHRIISELRMRKEYRIADMVEGVFRYYRWQTEGLREKKRLLKVFISNDGKEIKQLYNGEEVEKIVKEREGYKHRAEVAERALKLACKTIAPSYVDTAKLYFAIFVNQAEKELAEEGEK